MYNLSLYNITSDEFAGYNFITVVYDTGKLFGTISVDDINYEKSLQVCEVHRCCISEYGI